MSSFLVEHETIDNILNHSYFSNLTLEQKTEKGKEMLRLNVEAINVRYNGKLTEEQEEFINDYEFQIDDVNPFQSLKSLHCLLYQCAEGKITHSTKYLEFSGYKEMITEMIIMNCPEYDKARWG